MVVMEDVTEEERSASYLYFSPKTKLFHSKIFSYFMVTSDQISTFFNIYRHKSVVLTQLQLIPSSTKLYRPIPPSTN